MDRCRRPGVCGLRRKVFLISLALGASVLLFLLWGATPARAQEARPDSACRLCHIGSEATVTLPSGEVLRAGIDPAVLDQSVHGAHAAADVYCTDCHAPLQRYQYPHPPPPEQNRAEYRDAVSQNCERCHTPLELHNPGHLQSTQSGASGEANAQDNAAGSAGVAGAEQAEAAANTLPATIPPGSLDVEAITGVPNCVECHGGHNVAPTDVLYAEPIAFCRSCHVRFEDTHVAAVHDEAVRSLNPAQDCRTCHTDEPQTLNDQCENCHRILDTTRTLPSGEVINLHVLPEQISTSVHGVREIAGVQYSSLQCSDCHREIAEEGPLHPAYALGDTQQLRTSVETACMDCHGDVASLAADGIHAQHIAEGELNAASCADCHGAHEIQDPRVPRWRGSASCAKCHGEIADQFADSVHGEALFGDSNPDVPVCTDCHGVHDMVDPTTAEFRLSSPQMCGNCHADEEMMARYDISTNVFDTYVADFHGTTVTLFQHTSPNEETNKAVCYDCHGIHNIQSPTDENSQVMAANLLVTCRQCHPDANENFTATWLGHYEPSLDKYPLVYLVDLFYKVLIPAVIGGFALFIFSDIYRRVTDRRRSAKGKHE